MIYQFWMKAGKKYCEDRNLYFIRNQDYYDEISKGKIY